MRLAEALAVAVAAAVIGAAGCQAPSPAPGPLDRHIRVFAQPDGRETTLAAALDAAAGADVVFVGETHLDAVTHDVELAILAGLAGRRENRIALTLEMFERDAQPALDDYLAGRTDEAAFLAASRPWGNYATDYRPLVEFARQAKSPVIAANAPAAVRRKVSMGGKVALDALPPAERAWLAAEIHPADDAYWARVDRATGSHAGDGPPPSAERRLYNGQNLWDNTMAESIARALDAHPGRQVVHMVGGFHVEFAQGTVAQLRRRKPDAKIVTISIRPVADLADADAAEGRGRADFTVAALVRARSADEGLFAVTAPSELRYRLRVPPGATRAQPVALLVWLGADGCRADDGMAYWRLALGDAVAIASVEPLHLTQEEDLRVGGRWSWPDTLVADHARIAAGLARIVEYVTTRLPVDKARVVIAGEGSGGAAVCWSAIHGDVAAPHLALSPTSPDSLRLAGFPDGKPVAARLEILGPAGVEETVDPALVAASACGLAIAARSLPIEPVAAAWAPENAVREALGRPPRVRSGTDAVKVLGVADSPSGWRWARLVARRLERDEGGVVIPAMLSGVLAPELGDVDRVSPLPTVPLPIPLAPGAFGGTTILVDLMRSPMPRDWRSVLASDPLRAKSRFHSVRLAFAGAPGPDGSLAGVLDELRAADTHNVLILPWEFAATPETMRALAAEAAGHTEGMTIHWLPGYGGTLALAGAFDPAPSK